MKTANRAVPAGNLASLNRRDFLRAAGQTATALAVASTAAPAILSAPAPGRTLGVGCIGIGTRGGDLLNAVVAAPGVKVVAVSDVYGPHRQKGLDRSQNPEARSKKAAETGVYYRLMVEQLKKVLADPKRVFPAYDEKQGCEVAGFVWLQGWNELVDGDVYPERHKPGGYAAYSQALAHFVRDVRKDLNAPEMPFVIGVMRSGGLKDKSVDMLAFRQAMAVPAAGPEFKGNVAAVQTAPFSSEEPGAIAEKHEKVKQMRWFLDSKHKDHADADGKITEEQKREFIKKFEADLITPAEVALWKRGASNAGYRLPRLRENLRPDGQSSRRGEPSDVG